MRTNQAAGLDMVFGPAGITAAGADVLYDTSTAFNYCINGKAYAKSTISSGNTAALTDANTGLGFVALAADEACAFLWLINADGTVAVAQGPVVAIDGDTDLFKDDGGRPEFPAVPDGYVPFAYSLHQTSGASSAWTFGTSLWNAAGLTDVLVDISVLPDRPQADARS